VVFAEENLPSFLDASPSCKKWGERPTSSKGKGAVLREERKVEGTCEEGALVKYAIIEGTSCDLFAQAFGKGQRLGGGKGRFKGSKRLIKRWEFRFTKANLGPTSAKAPSRGRGTLGTSAKMHEEGG